MVEILKSFEQVAGRFSPAVLIVPALVMVALGLLAWLAGMCLRRLVLALIGAAGGLLVSFVLSGPSPPVSVLAAGGGAAFGVAAPRAFVAVLLAACGMAVTFAVVARTPLLEEQGTLFGDTAGDGEDKLTGRESLDAVRMYALDVTDHAGAAGRQLAPVDWLAVVAVGGGLLGLGLLFGRLAGALTCSVLGAMLIFTGMMVLLAWKGASPVTRLERQGAFYGVILLGMIAFGTLEQLVLCPTPRRESKAGAGKAKGKREESKRGWRNR